MAKKSQPSKDKTETTSTQKDQEQPDVEYSPEYLESEQAMIQAEKEMTKLEVC